MVNSKLINSYKHHYFLFYVPSVLFGIRLSWVEIVVFYLRAEPRTMPVLTTRARAECLSNTDSYFLSYSSTFVKSKADNTIYHSNLHNIIILFAMYVWSHYRGVCYVTGMCKEQEYPKFNLKMQITPFILSHIGFGTCFRMYTK